MSQLMRTPLWSLPAVLGAWVKLVAVFVLSGSMAAGEVVYDLVPVGDPGNPANGSYGSVNYEYYIGTYEVTIGQYVDFLNAVAKTDTNNLYSTSMASWANTSGIDRTGSPGSYEYAARTPRGSNPPGADSPTNRPITFVNLFDAMRFANWMANGQPTGPQNATTTENGAFDMSITPTSVPTKNFTNPNTGVAPNFWLPTENEWYKAAYYDPFRTDPVTGNPSPYWTYATMSDSPPDNFDLAGFFPNQANVRRNLNYTVPGGSTPPPDQNLLTDVGTFASTYSYYGAFDMTGNVREWSLPGLSSSASNQGSRVARGGDFNTNNTANMGKNVRFTPGVTVEEQITGFRLASNGIFPVPEPSTWLLAAAGLAGLAGLVARRGLGRRRLAGEPRTLLP